MRDKIADRLRVIADQSEPARHAYVGLDTLRQAAAHIEALQRKIGEMQADAEAGALVNRMRDGMELREVHGQFITLDPRRGASLGPHKTAAKALKAAFDWRKENGYGDE